MPDRDHLTAQSASAQSQEASSSGPPGGSALQDAGSLQIQKQLAAGGSSPPQLKTVDDATKTHLYKQKLAQAKDGPKSSWSSANAAEGHDHDKAQPAPGQGHELLAKGGKAIVGSARANLSSSEHEVGASLLHRKNAHGEVTALGVGAQAGHFASVGGSSVVSLSGNAGATATLVDGIAHVETKPMEFDFFGERVLVEFAFKVEGSVLAEAGADASVDVAWNGLGATANVFGFAGAKGILSGTGKLHWMKKAANHYADELSSKVDWKNNLSFLPQHLLEAIPPGNASNLFLRKLLGKIVTPEEAKVLGFGVKWAGEGSAGIGAAASFDAEFQGGVFKWHGKAGVTFGLGAGTGIDLLIGARHGVALVGVAALRGANQALSDIHSTFDIRNLLLEHASSTGHA